MSIVKMKRLTLLALRDDKDKIYDSLIRSRLVELKRSCDIESCFSEDESAAIESVAEKISRVEQAISYVSEQTGLYNTSVKRGREKVEVPKNGFSRPKNEVTYDDFLNFSSNAERADKKLEELDVLKNEISLVSSDLAKARLEYDNLFVLRNLAHPTDWYSDTDTSYVQLSLINSSELDKLKKLAENYSTVTLEILDAERSVTLLAAVAHKSEGDFFNEANGLGLVKCAVNCGVVPKIKLKELFDEIVSLKERLQQLHKRVADFSSEITLWKTYVDYLGLKETKLYADNGLQKTWKTFVLEGYCPAEAEEKVAYSIRSVSDCAVLNFYDIAEDEYAPTLVKNNAVTKQFEYVTNMYTPPEYHEIDPNPVMSVFYFLIFGLMVADMGYGLLLVLAGVFAHFAIKQQTGIKTMLQLFGICGVSAIAVGALFGSMFSYPLYPGIIPDPSKYPMVMMILSLLLGIVHICAGIACNMAVKIKHKQALSAWLADFPWILVFVSLILAIFNSALDMAAYEPYEVLRLPEPVPQIALYVCLGSLAVALIFAGLGHKGILGKLMKSFGSAYGIINYFSDIMSYIRVFGLMLSSALMGTVINQLGEMVASGGGLGYVFAAILLVFAHLFNLVMGILGVYIHNGRLQYVEFFGKFYTGDGNLFTPFGSETKYTLVKD